MVVALGLFLLILPRPARTSLALPLQTALLAPLRGARSLGTAVAGRALENRRLSRLAAELSIENARLRTLCRQSDVRPAVRPDLVAAPIISRDLATFERQLVVSRGRRHGVLPGAAVIVPDGVVGRVVAAGEHQSLVQTILDPESRVAVYDARSQVPGLALPAGSGLLALDYVAKGADFMAGDTLLTSGIGGIFPKGLRLGVVVVALDEPARLFKTVRLRPFTVISRLEHVFVVRLPGPDSTAREDGWLDNLAPVEVDIPEQGP